MKKLVLLITLILFGIHLIAQRKCIDKVYPTENRKSISHCCIKDIKAGNVVVYTKNGIDWNIDAIAITLNGEYIELKENNDSVRSKVLLLSNPEGLYEGHNYNYYKEINNKSSSKLAVGTCLAVLGGGLFVGGAVTVGNKVQNYSNDTKINGVGFLMILTGAAGLGVGIPVAITGGIKARKSKDAMKEIERQSKLSLQITNNGVGLVYNF